MIDYQVTEERQTCQLCLKITLTLILFLLQAGSMVGMEEQTFSWKKYKSAQLVKMKR